MRTSSLLAIALTSVLTATAQNVISTTTAEGKPGLTLNKEA